jgi:hypothetical protein
VSRDLVRSWRDGLLLVGTDSTTVQSVWGPPRKRTLHSNGLRIWSYSLGDRGGPKDGWLQFYFTKNGKLWQVTRGPEFVSHLFFPGTPRDGR